MKDIENSEDIKILVDEFYLKVRKDDLLAPVFALRITDWQPHMNTMYRFWNAALFQVRESQVIRFPNTLLFPLRDSTLSNGSTCFMKRWMSTSLVPLPMTLNAGR